MRSLRRLTIDRPLHRLQRVILGIVQLSQCADVEDTLTFVFETGQARMFAKNLRRPGIRKRFGKAQTVCHLGKYPPIRLGFPRCWHECSLPRNTPFGISHHAILLTPPLSGQQNVSAGSGIGMLYAI